MASFFKREALFLYFVTGIFFFWPTLLVVFIFLSTFADPNSIPFYCGISILLVGWCLLVQSKWHQVRKGDLLTFGISASHPEMRIRYRMSYIIMIFGSILACFSGVISNLFSRFI
jgi:hypothetical protein